VKNFEYRWSSQCSSAIRHCMELLRRLHLRPRRNKCQRAVLGTECWVRFRFLQWSLQSLQANF